MDVVSCTYKYQVRTMSYVPVPFFFNKVKHTWYVWKKLLNTPEQCFILEYVVIITRRFAPRAAYAARYACSGRRNSVKRKKKSPCLIVSASWRLEKRAPRPSRKTTHRRQRFVFMVTCNERRRHAHGYTANVPGTSYIVVLAMYIYSFCRYYINKMNRHGHWLGVLD